MSTALPALLHLCDSLFPLGSFAHSDGLETATSGGRVASADDLQAWMTTSLDESLGRLEGPALWRAWRIGAPRDAAQLDALVAVDAELHALRPSASGRDASRAMGTRLLKTWRQIHPETDLELIDLAHGKKRGGTFTLPVAFGVVCRSAGVSAHDALTGFMYTRLAASVSAAMRLMAIGQHDGHTRLVAMLSRVPAQVDAILGADDPPRSFAPAMDIAAMRQQYGASRLFRS